MNIKKSESRGRTELDWLNSYHSFSFGDYIDLNNRGFENLRVINEDEIAAGTGFDFHPHANMEIVTYVLSGTLEHKDSMGNYSLINTGDVQRMSAGTGILHSEYNNSDTQIVKLMQIWILPELKDIEPSYQQEYFSDAEKTGILKLIVSKTGRDGSLIINQDIDIYASILNEKDLSYQIAKEKAWVQVLNGSVAINGQSLNAGDGLAIDEVITIKITNAKNAEFLVFDMNSKKR